MKKLNDMYVIGIDHGYGNMKTANCCFPTGVLKSDKEPIFINDLLVWNGRYYSIGAGHKEFTADKFEDEDYCVLTLAAIARELKRERIAEAKVFIAAGLPLTWVSEQKESFKKYLLQNKEVTYIFRNVEYRLQIVGAEIFPQGFAAVAEKLGTFTGVNLLCDIGNGTMNLLKITNRVPDTQHMFTEKYGVHQCTILIREQMMRLHHATLDDAIITEILKKGTADIDKAYLETVVKTAKSYTAGIFQRLREHEYNPKLMKLYVVGGGGCLIRNFGEYDSSRVVINDDICATAKGYEYMAMLTLNRKAGGV
ncbi:MAG: ParM/StbA family protein [Ruminococcaceae bacterium]|nr:ParM/StbA family protein [Oscillospiraceae bacterium]